MGIGGIGFLLMYVATIVPFVSYISCTLIGIGMLPCQMLPLYGMVIMKSHPSKSISPMIVGLALVAVLVQGSMVEILRSAPTMLYLTYAVIMVILVILYMQVEPFFLFNLRRRIADDMVEKEEKVKTESSSEPFCALSLKEKEVTELICLCYTNRDIAKIMFISEHTVKDHTKKIYPTMGVHSRFELATLVSKYRADDNVT